MPLIQVHLNRSVFDAHHEDIGRAIHEAQVEALGIPDDDRFQIFQPHGSGELKFDPGYNGVDRRDLLVIRVIAVHMYPTATKQAFFRRVVDKLEPLGIRREDVLICLTENGFEDWYAGRN
ncbi:tautomerase family protein [Rugosimonospora africana]|uniref:Tautomerase n=1 Tax=Rugosimonospora africana TaxID=556532 RepID=A0A8J3VQT9_9ACTN|nr:tautomerase family protein [Rugosimonospora africana]GIH15459.1 tautomerase [Rugosimonospora africana]